MLGSLQPDGLQQEGVPEEAEPLTAALVASKPTAAEEPGTGGTAAQLPVGRLRVCLITIDLMPALAPCSCGIAVAITALLQYRIHRHEAYRQLRAVHHAAAQRQMPGASF